MPGAALLVHDGHSLTELGEAADLVAEAPTPLDGVAFNVRRGIAQAPGRGTTDYSTPIPDKDRALLICALAGLAGDI